MILSPKVPRKVAKLVQTYSTLIFEFQLDLETEYLEIDEHLRNVPDQSAPWQPITEGMSWGAAWKSAWFRTRFSVPEYLSEKPLFLRAVTDAVESLFWVNGKPRGIFTNPRQGGSLGNHHTLLITPGSTTSTDFELALEGYAWHPFVGTQPFDTPATQTAFPSVFVRTFEKLQIMTRRDDVMNFVFDLQTVVQLFNSLPEASFRRGRLAKVIDHIFVTIPQDPSCFSEEIWRPALANARQALNSVLECPAETSAPTAGLIGHSHLDTAWLWPIDETIRKAARTYSNALSLMEQYPEYTFIQSSPYHAELMRRHYPSIWEGISQRVAEGRWEPNGGMWIECDCNLTGGESMIRQFLKGITFTRAHFDYTPDVFWLPDTFGYSAAIPQIMLGFGLKYFLTTKLTWNETNTFPYDTFWWDGLDGSRVLTHFNDIHCWPDAETLINKLIGGAKDFRTVENYIQHKDVNDRRLISFGMGDGGGGPQYEMLELARRCHDLEGSPRAVHTTVSRFMHELEGSITNAPVHTGELYFEGHRGSLTSIHEIKRGNRRAEFAVRELEFLLNATGLAHTPDLRARLSSVWDKLLINQFHDILPGTSIPVVHDQAIWELAELLNESDSIRQELIGPPADDLLTLWNSLNWERRGIHAIHGVPKNLVPKNITWQQVQNVVNETILILQGPHLPALGSTCIPMEPLSSPSQTESPFRYDGHTLKSPCLLITFSDDGQISSFRTLQEDREICLPGGRFNTFLSGEDIPEAWDNWDIDEDQFRKLVPQTRMVTREVVASGPLQFRLRCTFTIGDSSTLTQDLVLYADSPRVEFDTVVNWVEKRTLLKVGFETTLHPVTARHEIQFGHLERPVFRNNRLENAKFEVCNHKWTSISENRHGVALLNDCKYAISTHGGELRLTLLKSGLHPDPRGNAGVHHFVYSFLPYEGSFSAENVIRPAYELNAPISVGGGSSMGSMFTIDAPNLVCESIKPAEDGRGYIVRLYEAERSSGRACIRFSRPPSEVKITNLLEEDIRNLPLNEGQLEIEFGAFQILSLRVV